MYTEELNVIDTNDHPPVPVFRICDENGKVLVPNYTCPLDDDTLIKMYKTMVLEHVYDDVFYRLQRVGKISFYMENEGEEGLQVASAAAWKPEDSIWLQYRELGVCMWRGMTLQQLSDDNYSNSDCVNRGRQMPVHYGSKELKLNTVSSPLATQMPQAAGAGYALKLKGLDAVSVCYFGEGAASEGDAHVAFNFSATRGCPTIWMCRNNAFAISTPTEDQYRGDGILARAAGYGMYAIRVDGNDILATYEACSKAREIAINEQRPVLIEAMTYRGSHHSTSDNADLYRDAEDYWSQEGHPISRFMEYLVGRELWDAEKDGQYKEECKALVRQSYTEAEAKLKPCVDHLFSDVYDNMPERLQEQKEQLELHLDSSLDAALQNAKDDYYDRQNYAAEP